MTLEEYRELIKDSIESFLLFRKSIFIDRALSTSSDIAEYLYNNEEFINKIMSTHRTNAYYDVTSSIPLLNQICLQKGISHKKIGNLVLKKDWQALDTLIKKDYYWEITVDLLQNSKFIREALLIED